LINRLFRYFASGRYDRALKLAETLCQQTLTNREMSFVILTADLADFFQGGNQNNSRSWIADALQALYEKKPEPNEFLVLLMAFEGSKLFQSDPERGMTMLEQAKTGVRTPTEAASVLFFIALFEMNLKGNYDEVLQKLLQVRSGMEGNQEYSLFTFIRFWNEVMIGHVSNQMGQFKESDIISRQALLHCNNLSLYPLMENIYMNLAFSQQGLEDAEKTEYYLLKNIQYWEEKSNPYKLGLALVMAFILLLQLGEKDKALAYLKRRKDMNYTVESQWHLIRAAMADAEMDDLLVQWEWKEEEKE